MEKTIALSRQNIITSIQFALLVGIAVIAPLFHYQPITGPIVNATLFIAAVLFGTSTAIFVGLLPSIIALGAGLLPAVLAPMIPFIMLSNAVLIVVFSVLKTKNFWLGVISASILKFLLLFSTSSIVIELLIKKEIASKVSVIMSYPQLLTALGGGIIAYGVLKIIKKI